MGTEVGNIVDFTPEEQEKIEELLKRRDEIFEIRGLLEKLAYSSILDDIAEISQRDSDEIQDIICEHEESYQLKWEFIYEDLIEVGYFVEE